MLLAIAVLLFGILVLLLDRFVIKSKPKRDWVPMCFTHKTPMVKVYPTRDMPDKIRHYLTTYGLDQKVLRKYVCSKCGRELWIAPQIEDMTNALFVQRKA